MPHPVVALVAALAAGAPSPAPLPDPPPAAPASAAAQALTLDEALALAARQNRDRRAARQGLAGAEAGLDQALATRFPTLSGAAGLAPPGPASLSGQLTIDYGLDTHGARRATIAGQTQQVRFAALEAERTEQAVRRRVAEAYYDLVGAGEQRRIARLNVSLAETSLRDATVMQRSGEGTAFDVQRAQVQLGSAQASENDAGAAWLIASRTLARTIGLGPGAEPAAASAIAPVAAWELSLEESVAQGLARRPELASWAAQREAALALADLTRANRRPQTSAFVSGSGAAGADWTGLSLPTPPGLTGGLRLSWLMVDWGMNEAGARQAELTAAAAQTRGEDQALQVRLEVGQAYAQMRAAQADIAITERVLEVARAGLNSARLRFKGGVGTQTDVLLAQGDLVNAEGSRVRAIVAYNKAIVALEQVSAARDLGEPNAP